MMLLQQGTDWGKVVESLAAKLSVPAGQLWAVLVRQARIDAIEATVWMVLCVVILGWLGTGGVSKAKAIHANNSYDGWLVWFPWTALLVTASLILACYAVPTVLRGFLNPEFGALKYLLDAAK